MENFPSLSVKLQYNQSRGYHISLSCQMSEEIPEIFIQKVKSGKKVLCSTDTLVSLEERRKEAFIEIIHLTGQIMQNVLSRVRSHVSWMYKLSEIVSLVDMLCSFAKYVTLSDVCVRPIFGDSGPIAIKDGKHPIKSKHLGSEFIMNDSFLTEVQRIQIITGPNGSGKSTYLEQIGLITIMGHIGCYVPASFARLRKLQSIMSKLSHYEEIGSNMGGFFKECREISFILRNATHDSLILVDEFGRGTSCLEGTGLSWAFCEKMIEIRPALLFCTHFSELTALSKLYCTQIKHLCFSAKENEEHHRLTFTYKIKDAEELKEDVDSFQKLDHYGLAIARMSQFPKEIVDDAEHISCELMNMLKINDFEKNTSNYCLLLEKLEVLMQMDESSDDLVDYISHLQQLARTIENE
jgi:DNA mismatch repair protein MSH4